MPLAKVPFDPILALPTPRVWSVLVTIFGDLARGDGETVSGPTLTQLTEGMGIKPEAVRVALHRLRNDDWISSVKFGRTARHALTEHGLKESRRASRIIYDKIETLPQGWQVVLIEQNDPKLKNKLLEAGFVQIVPRMFLSHDEVALPRGCVVTKGHSTPNWLGRQIIPAHLTEQYDKLLAVLRTVSAELSSHGAMSALDTALARCLIVHHWRRLVLRFPYLPPVVTGQEWPGHQCRVEVTRLLARLPRPPLEAL